MLVRSNEVEVPSGIEALTLGPTRRARALHKSLLRFLALQMALQINEPADMHQSEVDIWEGNVTRIQCECGSYLILLPLGGIGYTNLVILDLVLIK